MITDALLGILLAFINFITSYFTTQADVPVSNFLTTAVANGASLFAGLNLFFPFNTMFQIIAFELTFEGIYLVYKLIRWAYQKVPGVN
jgi:hypothetical protein